MWGIIIDKNEDYAIVAGAYNTYEEAKKVTHTINEVIWAHDEAVGLSDIMVAQVVAIRTLSEVASLIAETAEAMA
jgi:hypothetical protein